VFPCCVTFQRNLHQFHASSNYLSDICPWCIAFLMNLHQSHPSSILYHMCLIRVYPYKGITPISSLFKLFIRHFSLVFSLSNEFTPITSFFNYSSHVSYVCVTLYTITIINFKFFMRGISLVCSLSNKGAPIPSFFKLFIRRVSLVCSLSNEGTPITSFFKLFIRRISLVCSLSSEGTPITSFFNYSSDVSLWCVSL
jgi:hypothetical protein